MAPRFHFMDPDVFLDTIPGSLPTEDDYTKFRTKGLELSSKHERELHKELASVVQSVLDAAGCDVLRFMDTINHKPNSDGATRRKDIFTDDGGIYTSSPLACDAPGFTSSNHDKAQVVPGESGFHLRCCLDVPFWVSMSRRYARAIYFESQGSTGNTTQTSISSTDQGLATPQGGDVEDEGQNQSGAGDGVRALDDRAAVEGCISEAATEDRHNVSDGGLTTTAPQALSFVKISRRGNEVLDKFAEYMLNLFKHQHRTFSYAVCVCCDMARLFYFDRSGILVTEPFRWDETGSLLHCFIWKITKLANAGRFEDLGHDLTATLASGEAKDMFLTLKDDPSLPQHVRDGFKTAAADGYPVYKLEVTPGEPSEDEWFGDMSFPPPKGFGLSTGQPQPSPSQSPLVEDLSPQPGTRSFLVGRPHFAADRLVGRCTRGYFAYDVTDADSRNWRVCFLKDSWRPVVPGRTRPEHLVYQRLRFFGVDKGIGTLLCGGDVGGHWAQWTRVQDYLPADENGSNAVVRVHYRLVVEEIGIPLEDFDSFPELSAILVDAISAHHHAWSLAKVLHCDISVRNIMILPATAHSPRRTGFLIDWDFSRLESELETGPGLVEPNRTGTWQFRSALWLALPWKPYRRTDDVESFIHVYLYLVLRYHATSLLSLHQMAAGYFDSMSLVHGIKVGGDQKLVQLSSPRLSFSICSNPALQDLLDAIILKCSQSYDMLDLSEMRRRYGLSRPSLQPLSATTEAETVTFPILSSTESDDGLPRSKNVVLRPIQTPPRRADPDEDISVVGGILSDVGDLMDLFRAHATHLRQDKACDQFEARQHEIVFRPV